MEASPSSPSTGLAHPDEFFADAEALALAGFLGGYSGLTRDAYTLDLRQFATWCAEQRLALFCVRRSDIECFARHLEALGRARATIAPATGHRDLLLPLCRGGRLDRALPGGARPPPPPRLRVPRHGPRPQ